jgi:hypothetical protein
MAFTSRNLERLSLILLLTEDQSFASGKYANAKLVAAISDMVANT